MEYPAEAPRRFVGDAGRIRQVLTNLVGNAVKFTLAGSVAIAVACEGREGGQARMRIAVRDTGVGIPVEKVGTLFQKFSQVDGSTTRRYGGTGLGLAISKQLVELMHGTIGVESRAGEGSTFWFSLPLALDAVPDAVPPAPEQLRGLRVLIVDDHEVNRRVLEEQVTQWGLQARSLAAPQEVIPAMRAAHAGGAPYQFVLLDYQMAVMDGATLADHIRADPEIGQAALIMLTSVGHWTEVRQMEGASVDASLVKPVRQLHLLNALLVAWSKRSGVAAAPRPQAAPAKRRRFEGSLKGAAIRALVAEDNVVNQKVAIRMLERLGVRADMAGNGLEAVEMVRLAPYDVVFMDCHMPEMDGYAATREIRKLQHSRRGVIVVAMTAEALAGARERCLEAGMDDYIAKPVKLGDLEAMLRKWVPRAAAGPAPQ